MGRERQKKLENHHRSMKKIKRIAKKITGRKSIFIALFLIILFIGFNVRKHDMYTWPRKGATFDEFAWTWQGMNLIQTGVPMSWSRHPQYKNRKDIYYQKVPFTIVKPYLEHPPVFGLIAGSYALTHGAKDMYHVDLVNIRGFALLLGLLSIASVFLLTYELYGKHVAFIAMLLYATIPSVAVGARLVQNENFFIPVWLFTLYLITKFIKTKKWSYRVIAAVLCGILGLAKVPWLAATVSVVMILLYHKRYKDIVKLLAITIPVFLLYFVYGFYYGKEVFLGLWKLQLNRYDLGFLSIFALWQKPYLIDRFYVDGWIYWGWFSMVLLFSRLQKEFKQHIVIISGFLAYFLVFFAGVPDEPGHGWYRYPFYPFLIISIALFIKEHFAKNWLLTFMFLVTVGTTLMQLTWVQAFGFTYLIFRLCILGWSIVLLPQFTHYKFSGRVGRIVSFVWLGIFILLNVLAARTYTEQ